MWVLGLGIAFILYALFGTKIFKFVGYTIIIVAGILAAGITLGELFYWNPYHWGW